MPGAPPHTRIFWPAFWTDLSFPHPIIRPIFSLTTPMVLWRPSSRPFRSISLRGAIGMSYSTRPVTFERVSWILLMTTSNDRANILVSWKGSEWNDGWMGWLDADDIIRDGEWQMVEKGRWWDSSEDKWIAEKEVEGGVVTSWLNECEECEWIVWIWEERKAKVKKQRAIISD